LPLVGGIEVDQAARHRGGAGIVRIVSGQGQRACALGEPAGACHRIVPRQRLRAGQHRRRRPALQVQGVALRLARGRPGAGRAAGHAVGTREIGVVEREGAAGTYEEGATRRSAAAAAATGGAIAAQRAARACRQAAAAAAAEAAAATNP